MQTSQNPAKNQIASYLKAQDETSQAYTWDEIKAAQSAIKEGFTEDLYRQLDYLDSLDRKDHLHSYYELSKNLFKDGWADEYVTILKEAFGCYAASEKFSTCTPKERGEIVRQMTHLVSFIGQLHHFTIGVFDQAEDKWFDQQHAIANSCNS